MKTNVLEVAMGGVVLVVFTFCVIFAYSMSQWNSSTGYEVIAKFTRIDGLMRGSDVRLSGVKVGTIKDIHLDPITYLAVIRLALEPQITLPTDSSAEVASEGLLGGKFVALVPGGEDETIQPGGQIMHTQAAVNLETLIGKFIFSSQEKKDDSNQ
jgi:phospholipid/cholesterol/gamma-HCH transport system substrate-binding protein